MMSATARPSARTMPAASTGPTTWRKDMSTGATADFTTHVTPTWSTQSASAMTLMSAEMSCLLRGPLESLGLEVRSVTARVAPTPQTWMSAGNFPLLPYLALVTFSWVSPVTIMRTWGTLPMWAGVTARPSARTTRAAASSPTTRRRAGSIRDTASSMLSALPLLTMNVLLNGMNTANSCLLMELVPCPSLEIDVAASLGLPTLMWMIAVTLNSSRHMYCGKNL